MHNRRVRANAYGLVMPPPHLDCLLDNCRYDAKCFVDRHHLYFPRRKFSQTELLQQFSDHPFNSVWMSRCQHELYHLNYTEALVPPSETVEAFLEEADVLLQLGVTAIRYANIELGLSSENLRHIVRIACSEHPEHFEEVRDERFAQVVTLSQSIAGYSFELVAPEIVADPLAYIGRRNQPQRLIQMARAAIADAAA
jgi:hypothetical protein